MSTESKRECAKCQITSMEDVNLRFHRFPLPGKHGCLKARVWAEFCYPGGNWSTEESLKSLHRQHKMLCSKHFDDSSYTSSTKERLNNFAIPTGTENLLLNLRQKLCFTSYHQEIDKASVAITPTQPCSSKHPPSLKSHNKKLTRNAIPTLNCEDRDRRNPQREVLKNKVLSQNVIISRNINEKSAVPSTSKVLYQSTGQLMISKVISDESCADIDEFVPIPSTSEDPPLISFKRKCVSDEEDREPAIHEDVISDNTFSDEEDREPAIHEDVICDNCSGNIISFRYKCVTCDNYDLCQKCEMLELHSNHYMLRIPLCLKFEFAGNFIVKLREVLKCDQTLLAPTKHTDKAHKTVISNVNNNDKDIVDVPENDKRRIQSEVDRSLRLAKVRKNNKENSKRPSVVISDSRVIKKQRNCKENKIIVQVHKVKNINNVAGEVVIEHAPQLVFDKRKTDFHENTEITDVCLARHQEQQDNVSTFYMKTGIDLSHYMIQVVQNSEDPT